MKRFLKNKKHMKSLLSRYVLSYVLMFFVPFILIGIFTVNIAVDLVKENMKNNYLYELNDIKENIDKEVYFSNKYTYEISQQEWLLALTEISSKNDITTQMYIDFEKKIETYLFLNDIAYDIAIYIPEHDFVFSSKEGADTFVNFFSHTYDYDIDADKIFLKYFENSKHPVFIPMTNTSRYGQTQIDMITLITDVSFGKGSNKAYLISLIEEPAFRKYVYSSLLANNGAVCVLDENNNYLTGYNLEDWQIEELKEQSYEDEKGSFMLYRESHKFDGIYFKSDYFDWRIIAVTKTDAFMQEANNIIKYILMILMIVFIVGLLISFFVARRNYKPIRKMIQSILVKTNIERSISENEFQFMENTLAYLIDNQKRVQEDLVFYRPIVKNSCLQNILVNSIENIEDSKKILELMQINFSNTYFNCVFCRLNNEILFDDNWIKELNQCLVPLKTIAYVSEFNLKEKVIIFNTSFEGNEKRQLEAFIEYIDEQIVMFDVIGVGNTYKKIEAIHLSYEEAIEASNYKLLESKQLVFFYNDYEKEKESYYILPIDQEQKFRNYIKRGDQKSATSILMKIWTDNVEERLLTPLAIKNLVHHLSGVIVKCQLNENSQMFEKSIDVIYDLNTKKQLISFLESQIKTVCNSNKQAKESNNDKLIKEVLEYIKANYSDYNLTLTNIARVFNVSPSYLSRYIKDQTGKNYIRYINDLRIGASKLLLKKEEYTILEVAKMVGFDNDANYRKHFKSREGMTPGQFRNTIVSPKV